MKKVIILIVITLFSMVTTNAQKSANYVSLVNSNNDPAQYLKNNFENQSTKYIGQPLSKIFNDLDLKILSSSPINRVAPGMTGRDKKYIAGIYLCFYDRNEFMKKTKEERKQMKCYALMIYTKDLLLRSEYETLLFKNPLNIDADIKALYLSKNYLVDKIEVIISCE